MNHIVNIEQGSFSGIKKLAKMHFWPPNFSKVAIFEVVYIIRFVLMMF